VRHLRRGDDGEIAQAVVPPGEHTAALERQHALARGADFAPHRDGGRRLCHLDPSAGAEGDEHVVVPVLVKARGAGLSRLQHVDDGRKLFELGLDGSCDVLRLTARASDARGDDFADEPHLAMRQDRLARVLEAGRRARRPNRPHAGKVFGGEDRVPVLIRNADRLQPRMGNGTAHEGDIAGAGNAEIGDILAAPAQEALVLFTRNGSADARCKHVILSLKRVACRTLPAWCAAVQ
jgi:hypothetical protein